MDLMRQPGKRPTQGLAGMGDHPTGVALYAGIVTALLHRERTGEGGMVHTSLLANGLWSASGVAGGALAGGDMAAFRERSATPSALMRVYQTSDGRWLQFNMVRNEELLSLMCTALGAPDLLADEKYRTPMGIWEHRAELGDRQSPPSWPPAASDEWLSEFAALGVPVNRIAVVEEIAADEQVLANDMGRGTPRRGHRRAAPRDPIR